MNSEISGFEGAIGHVQIAGVPGRHEPDVGSLDFRGILERLDALGYTGYIGCEYHPPWRYADGARLCLTLSSQAVPPIIERRIVAVTGGALGIGKAAIERFTLEGWDVVVNYLLESERDAAESLIARARESGSDGATVQADVA